MNVHDLKTLPEFFDSVLRDEKTFEVRKDDRGFEVGDVLHLQEWDDGYTGRSVNRRVKYILRDAERYGLMEGYVVLGLG